MLRAEPGVLEQSEEQLQLKAAFFCDVIGDPAPKPTPAPSPSRTRTRAPTRAPYPYPYP